MTVDQRALAVGNGFRLPCSDLDDSDDWTIGRFVLSVEPMQPLLTAASLGGARRDDDCRLQVDSLNGVLSVEAWAAENRHETSCPQTLNEMSMMSRMQLVEDGPGVIVSGRKSNVGRTDVSRDICVVPDQCPVLCLRWLWSR